MAKKKIRIKTDEDREMPDENNLCFQKQCYYLVTVWQQETEPRGKVIQTHPKSNSKFLLQDCFG